MRFSLTTLFTLCALQLLGISVVCGDDATQVEFFEQKIRPILVEKCYSCHAGEPDQVEGKLWLDTKVGWEKGGQSGPAIVPGKPEASLLLQAIKRTDKQLVMPPDEALSNTVIADFETWIKQGAIDPRVSKNESDKRATELSAREQWVFTKPLKPELPTVHNQAWCQQPLDHFILSQLEMKSIQPAAQATPEQLVRRLYLDLHGLPPKPEEVDIFIKAYNDDAQAAVATLVDALLAQPAYGEKWGRYWLDCVRYADSLDARSKEKTDIADAWRYRDWVVSALNADLPYDQFVRDQIAGDLLSNQKWNADQIIATGVYAIGNWGNGDSDKKKVHTDLVDDQIDVTSRVFLGLTVACARCHDHKFDPISTADYYALSGFFFSSHILEKFAKPTDGESMMHIDLLPPAEKMRRDHLNSQISKIDQQLKHSLHPLTQRHEKLANEKQLISWSPQKTELPMVMVNLSDTVQSYTTIQLPAQSLCVHPAHDLPVTVTWKSPVNADIQLTAMIYDVDGTCGDGVAWSLANQEQTLAQGTLENGSSVPPIKQSLHVEKDQLVRLTIHPQKDHFCDGTGIELQIKTSDQVWSLTSSLLEQASHQEQPISPFIVCAGDAPNYASESEAYLQFEKQKQALKSQLPVPITCEGLQDGGIPGSPYAGFHDAAIHVRGSYNRLTAVQPRGFPAIFHSSVPPLVGSGRLALADWVVSSENPLTARVIVNRLWQHHFGRGIVATPNNFGKLGAPPTHPELLDWLAVSMMEHGWSLKTIHRMICTSATYLQSSQVTHETLKLDPDNLLYSRQQRRKLTAEELRDALLVVTGQLDFKLGGPPTADLKSPRRTLYLKIVRSDRSTYQLLFDGADPTSIIDQRNDSLVAPQALWLINHPFVLEQSRILAEQYAPTGEHSHRDQLARLIKRLYTREAQPAELDLLSEFLQQSGGDGWQKICHVLLCSNEFMFVE
jgi:hypothetical protein